MKPIKFLLSMEYIDVSIKIEAMTDEATVISLMLASAMMKQAKEEGYGNPTIKMKLGIGRPRTKNKG